MLYNDFILAGITLEEIATIENIAAANGLELSEDNMDLCLIESNTEEVLYRGLSEIVEFMKRDMQGVIDAVEEFVTVDIMKTGNIILSIESKLIKSQQAA